MQYVLFYDCSPDVMELAPIHYPAHKARVDAFQARGELLTAAPFSDPVSQGSMAIFTSRQAAEAFVEDDPFVREGVVTAWRIWEWLV